MPRRKPATNGQNDDTVPIPAVRRTRKSKDLVPIIRKGRDLDMAIFEREISRILNKMRYNHGRRDQDTEPGILRALETYEAATSESE